MDYLLAALPLVPSLIAFHGIKDELANKVLIASLVIGVLGFWCTSSLIPVIGEYTKKSGLSGKDLGKKGTPNEDVLM
jgi:hypothetical protein